MRSLLLAGLVGIGAATAAQDAAAAFTISVANPSGTIDAFSDPAPYSYGPSTLVGGANSTVSLGNQAAFSGSNAGNPIVYQYSTTANPLTATSTQGVGAATLGSSFRINNATTSSTLSSIVVTITQDAYSFSPASGSVLSTLYTASYTGTGAAPGISVATTTDDGSTLTVSGLGQRSGSTGYTPGSGPLATITEVITITNLAAGQAITFSGSSAVATPAPPTVVAALMGMPALGLVGAWRRFRRPVVA